MMKPKKYCGLHINELYVTHLEKENENLSERVRLAELLLDKIDHPDYRQMIGTYKLLVKLRGDK